MAGEREETPASIARLNLEIAHLVQRLDPQDFVEVLSGRQSWLLNADDNQNQNQNGSRADVT